MILTKKNLREVLQKDAERFSGNVPGIRDWFLHNENYYIWKYIKLLRNLEYYENNKNKSLFHKIIWLWYIRKHKVASVKTGFFIFPNTVQGGLQIYHLGSVLISKHAKIGEHFTVRPGCVIGNIQDVPKSAIIEDDVELSLGVKMFGRVKIGRGAIINANSVLMTNVPPYAIVTGNPAKVIGFRMEPEQIVEYEKRKYPESKRLKIEVLYKNYEKYYLRKTKEITKFITL